MPDRYAVATPHTAATAAGVAAFEAGGNAVDAALENQAASVSPPKVAIPDPALTVRPTGP